MLTREELQEAITLVGESLIKLNNVASNAEIALDKLKQLGK